MILPCLYAALPNKQTSTYVELIQAVKLIVSPLAEPDNSSLPPYFPQVFLADFEIAVQNAFKHCFSEIEIKGCYFHFKHASYYIIFLFPCE